jgi:hypothetical protein
MNALQLSRSYVLCTTSILEEACIIPQSNSTTTYMYFLSLFSLLAKCNISSTAKHMLKDL